MQTVNAIYDSGNYMDVFERGIVEAEKKIIVSSSEHAQDNLMRIQSAQIAAELLEIALEE